MADIDRDGDLDFTVVDGGIFNNDRPILAWFEAPSFIERSLATPLTPFTGASKLADIDNDGDADFVVSVDSHSGANDEGFVYWYENSGNGSPFRSWQQHVVEAFVPNAFHIGELDVADMDGDGLQDIVVRHLSTPRIVIYFQNQNGSWTPRRFDTVLREGLTLSDMDGDNRIDIIANGFILFAPQNPRSGDWAKVVIDSAFSSANPVRLNNSSKAAATDLNNDGRKDLVFSSAEGAAVYLAWYQAPSNPRSGNWTRHFIERPQSNNHQVLLADFDLDGDTDIAGGFSFGDKGVVWWENTPVNGDPNFTRRTISNARGCYNCIAEDYDNDGDIDIIGPDEFGGGVYLYKNRTSDFR